MKTLSVGSGGGLDAARHGACDVAPVHLYDPETGTYNAAVRRRGFRLLRGLRPAAGPRLPTEDADRLGADGDAEGVDEAVRARGRGSRR